jgi:hypothetical protein
MATQGRGAAPKRKAGVSAGDYPIPPIYVVAPRPLVQDWEIVVGWIAACILVVLLLPLLGILYMDILEAKREVKTQVEKVEKLRRNLEQKEREEKK